MVAIFLFLILFAGLNHYRKRVLDAFADSSVLKRLMRQRPPLNFWLKAVCICFVWILASLALMQPKGDAHYLNETGAGKGDRVDQISKKRRPHDVIFLVDASLSMAVPDGRNGVTRLDAAKEIVDQIAAHLGGEEAALYAFTSKVSRLSPLTMDTLFVRMMAREIRINEGGVAGTDIGQALGAIRERYFEKTGPGLKTVILLSDGGDTRIESLSGSERAEAVEALAALAHPSDPRKTKVFTIGIGTEEGGFIPELPVEVVSRLDASLLEQISQKGYGKYYPANRLSVVDIAEDIRDSIQNNRPYYEAGEEGFISGGVDEPVVYDYYYQVPLAFAIFFLALVILVPDTIGKVAVLCIALFPLHGNDLEEARRWWEAGAYGRSIEIYEEMLQQQLSPYDESVVRYNLGTALLEDGQMERAVQMFRSIPLDSASPLVKRRLNTNTVVARLREETKTEDLPKKVFLLREAMRAIFEGEAYHCELAEIIQAPECAPAPNLKEMRAFIENDLSTALTDVQKFQIANANYIEGIPLLLSYVQSMLNDLRFLKIKAATPELEESYKKLFIIVADSWLPLWNRLKDRPNPPTLFTNAYQYNRYALILLRNEDYEASSDHFKEAERLLVELMRSGGIDTPEQEALVQLSRSYQLTLLQEPIQEVTLRALQREQEQIQGVALDTAERALKLAVALIKEGKPEEARIQVEVGQQEVRQILRRRLGELNPVTVLETSIELQEHALSLARLIEQTQGESGVESLQPAQKEVVATAATFFNEVILQQRKDFEESGRCQRFPWEMAVPEFYHGLQAARAALGEERMIPWQELALASWKKVLEMLKEEEKSEPEQEEEPADEAVRDLRKMQLNDSEPKSDIIPVSGEERPW